jgi:hypothetical protein
VPTRTDRVGDHGGGILHGVSWVGCRSEFDVLLLAEGMRPTRARGPAQDTDVRVEPALAIALQVDGLPPPPARCSFVVVTKPLSRGVVGEFAAEREVWVDREHDCPADGVVPLLLLEPGLVEVQVFLRQRLGSTPRTALVSATQMRFLADGTYRLGVPAGGVTRAMTELGLLR